MALMGSATNDEMMFTMAPCFLVQTARSMDLQPFIDTRYIRYLMYLYLKCEKGMNRKLI